MPFACPSDSPIIFCTPECARWYKINEGQQVNIFQDASGWDPDYYSMMVESPQTHLQRAVDIWNDAYPCGTLFNIVTDVAVADVVQTYPTTPTTNGLNGSITVIADNDGENCVLQLDQALAYGPQLPMDMKMYCSEVLENSGTATDDRYVNIFLHELGHALGMNHLSDGSSPPMSIMVNSSEQPGGAGLYPFDIEQLLRRYPCDCEIVDQLPQAPAPFLVGQDTSSSCPCCQGVDT